jgi:hypothetical protein
VQSAGVTLRTGLAVTGPAIACILLYLSPYLIWGQDAHVLIHDHLDQQPIQHWRYLHARNPFWRSGCPDESFLGGSTPCYTWPDLHGERWSYYFLPPFSAFLVNQMASRIGAFAGMMLLVRALLSGHPYALWISAGAGILFSLLNHYPATPFTVPALTWIVYGLLQIHRGQGRWWHWGVLCLVPFFSDFFLAPFFLLIVLGILWLAHGCRYGDWRPRTLAALALTTALYVVSSYEVVLHAVSGSYVSQRSLWRQKDTFPSFVPCLKEAVRNFLFGQYHAQSQHELILAMALGTVAVALGIRALSAWQRGGEGRKPSTTQPPVRMLLFLLGLAGVFSLWLGLSAWEPIGRWWLSLPTLSQVQFTRFHALHPVIWYLVLAYVLAIWTAAGPLRSHRWLALGLIGTVFAAQAAILVRRSDWMSERRAGAPTYRQFFAEKQFRDIAEFIGLPQDSYRVASVGLYPSIALYNGFYCLDGYLSDHSLAYHEAFRCVVRPELERSERACQAADRAGTKPPPFNYKRYFNWGIRCYLFSSELENCFVLCTRSRDTQIERLDIDRSAFREMGGRYLLSAVRISQAEACGLRLLRVFDGDPAETAWRVCLYEVLPGGEKRDHGG